jgi:hypothetical protein
MPFESNITDELLVNTCGLHQVLPINSSALITDVCPAVSTDSECVSTNKTHEFTSNGSDLYPVVISNGSQHGIDNIRSKSGSIQVEVDRKGGVNSINISILLILMAIFFVQLN